MAYAVAFEGGPTAGLIKELPAAPSAAEKPAVVMELPAVPSAAEKYAGVIKELPAGILKGIPAAPSASEKSVAPALRLLSPKGALYLRDVDDDDTYDKSSGKDADDDLLALGLSVPKLSSTDALDLFAEPKKLSQLLELCDGAASGTSFSARGWWVSKEDDDAMQLKVVMPGLGNEHVKVSAVKNILLIKGEGDKDPEDCDYKGPARYSRRFELPTGTFKMDQVKAKMNNGVLKVTVPKIKHEVFQIKVE